MAFDEVDKALLREAVFSGMETFMKRRYGRAYPIAPWRKDFTMRMRLRMRLRKASAAMKRFITVV
jgi:hypothetical protein